MPLPPCSGWIRYATPVVLRAPRASRCGSSTPVVQRQVPGSATRVCGLPPVPARSTSTPAPGTSCRRGESTIDTPPRVRTRGGVSIVDSPRWHEVPGAGVEVLRAGTGGNPHTLVADPGTCRWTTGVDDPQRLALGALSTTGVAYLIHPEHGGSGIAPGTYVIRRQRERSGMTRRPSGFPHARNPIQYVVD